MTFSRSLRFSSAVEPCGVVVASLSSLLQAIACRFRVRMKPIALVAFAFVLGALVQGMTRRKWLSIPLPPIVAVVWLAIG